MNIDGVLYQYDEDTRKAAWATVVACLVILRGQPLPEDVRRELGKHWCRYCGDPTPGGTTCYCMADE